MTTALPNGTQMLDGSSPAGTQGLAYASSVDELIGLRKIKTYKPATEAALNLITGMATGDLADQADTGYTWRYNGTVWKLHAGATPAFIVRAGGSQNMGGSWSLVNGAWTTPALNRGFTSWSGGVLRVKYSGFYDMAACLAVPNQGVQSIVITVNSTVTTSGAIVQVQQQGLTAFGSSPVYLNANDEVRMFGAAGMEGQPTQPHTFFSVLFRSA